MEKYQSKEDGQSWSVFKLGIKSCSQVFIDQPNITRCYLSLVKRCCKVGKWILLFEFYEFVFLVFDGLCTCSHAFPPPTALCFPHYKARPVGSVPTSEGEVRRPPPPPSPPPLPRPPAPLKAGIPRTGSYPPSPHPLFTQ